MGYPDVGLSRGKYLASSISLVHVLTFFFLTFAGIWSLRKRCQLSLWLMAKNAGLATGPEDFNALP